MTDTPNTRRAERGIGRPMPDPIEPGVDIFDYGIDRANSIDGTVVVRVRKYSEVGRSETLLEKP